MPQPMEDVANDKRVRTTISLLLCGGGPMSFRLHGSWRTGPTRIHIRQNLAISSALPNQRRTNATAYGGCGQ